MTEDDVLLMMEDAIREYPSMTAWADAKGLSPQYVSSVRKRRAAPGPKIYEALGLTREVTYRETNG